MKISVKKILFTLMISSTLAFGGALYYHYKQNNGIHAYNDTRDRESILELFRRDMYWLSADPNYSVEFMLTYRAPHQNPLLAGQLDLRVLHEQGQFIGFTGYYLENAREGKILFMGVAPQFRGKRYGEQLIRYAIDALAKKGVSVITLVTRPSNTSARRLYERVGFTQVHIDDDFVHYAYYL